MGRSTAAAAAPRSNHTIAEALGRHERSMDSKRRKRRRGRRLLIGLPIAIGLLGLVGSSHAFLFKGRTGLGIKGISQPSPFQREDGSGSGHVMDPSSSSQTIDSISSTSTTITRKRASVLSGIPGSKIGGSPKWRDSGDAGGLQDNKSRWPPTGDLTDLNVLRNIEEMLHQR